MIRPFSMIILALGAALASPAAAQPKVVTDIAPLAALVLLADPLAQVQVLAGGVDPHEMALRPSHIRAIKNADLVVWMGPEFSPWLADVLASQAGEQKIVSFATPISHPWLDPVQGGEWAKQLAAVLAEIAPDKLARYQEQGAKTQLRLTEMIDDVSAQLAPMQEQRILVAHDAFGAFADRFGLNVVDSIADQNGAAPGAAHLSKLQNQISAGQIDCIFGEFGESDEFVSMLSKSASVFVGTLDPLGMTPQDPLAYLTLITDMANEFSKCGNSRSAG